MITIINKSKGEKYDVYGGRGSKKPAACIPGQEKGWLGNPHFVGLCLCGRTHTRAWAIAAFKHDFWARVNNDPKYREAVIALEGQTIACFCKPLDCHLDVVAAWLNAGCPLRPDHA